MTTHFASEPDLMPPPFAEGLDDWSCGDGTPDSPSYDRASFARIAVNDPLGALFADGDEASRASSREASQGPSSDPERALQARAELQRLQRILGVMNPKHADVLVLHDVLGHELSAIAGITGLTVAAAQSRLVRGRKELLRRAHTEKDRSR